jgi:peptide/nickel transport system substrate-binding protein
MLGSTSRRGFLRLCAGAGLSILVGALGCLARERETPAPVPTTEAPRPQVKGTFIEGVSAGDAETLNWILAADSASFDYVGHTLDSLATYDNEYNVVLRHLAKDIEISEDGLVYTITIRDDLRWGDGSKVTAEDYVYTLKNLMFSDWLNYNYKSDWQEEVDGETVFVKPEVVDDNTFRIVRKTVDPEFVYNLYPLTPYPRYIAEKYEGDIKAFTEAKEFNELTYTGNLGPYRFVEWIRNDKYVVERNPDYYLGRDTGAPYFEKYVVKIFGSPAARHAALEAGDITYAAIDPLQVKKFKDMEGIKVYTVPTTGYFFMAFNLRKNGWEGFKIRGVRQALAMAIGKDILIQSVLLGFGDPAFSFIPKPSPWYVEEGLAKYGVEPLYDKQKAIELLQQHGYEYKDGVFLGKDGKPMKFSIATNIGNKIRESTAFLIKQELSDIGIEVELKLVPWPTLLRKYLQNKVPGRDQEPRFNNGLDAVSEEAWDLMIIGFGGGNLPIAPSGSSIFYETNGGLNFMGYSNKKVDELFAKAKSKEALDPSVRREIYAELSRILSEDLPVDFLAFQRGNHGFQANVEGIDPGIRMGYNYHEWYFA